MQKHHDKKLVLITGGTKGFGKAIALHFKDNYDLALVYSNDSLAAEKALHDIQSKSNVTVRLYKLDVSDFKQASQIHDQIVADFNKHVSILINCAGVALKNIFLMEDLESHRRSFEVNYFGTLNMCKHVLPSMMKNKYGRIINFSTNAVSVYLRGAGAYCASKAALEKFSEILGVEVIKSGVTVNSIRPGIAHTEMSHEFLQNLNEKAYQELLMPSGQLIKAEEIAKTVEFLIDSQQINSSTVTVDTGHAQFKKL